MKLAALQVVTPPPPAHRYPTVLESFETTPCLSVGYFQASRGDREASRGAPAILEEQRTHCEYLASLICLTFFKFGAHTHARTKTGRTRTQTLSAYCIALKDYLLPHTLRQQCICFK